MLNCRTVDPESAGTSDWCTACEGKAHLVAILAEPQRLRILHLLRGGERCVCEIERSLEIPQNLVSHHLKVLREAGLVTASRQGQFVHYARVEDRIREAVHDLEELVV